MKREMKWRVIEPRRRWNIARQWFDWYMSSLMQWSPRDSSERDSRRSGWEDSRSFDWSCSRHDDDRWQTSRYTKETNRSERRRNTRSHWWNWEGSAGNERYGHRSLNLKPDRGRYAGEQQRRRRDSSRRITNRGDKDRSSSTGKVDSSEGDGKRESLRRSNRISNRAAGISSSLGNGVSNCKVRSHSSLAEDHSLHLDKSWMSPVNSDRSNNVAEHDSNMLSLMMMRNYMLSILAGTLPIDWMLIHYSAHRRREWLKGNTRCPTSLETERRLLSFPQLSWWDTRVKTFFTSLLDRDASRSYLDQSIDKCYH